MPAAFRPRRGRVTNEPLLCARVALMAVGKENVYPMAVITVTTEPVVDPQTFTPSLYDKIVAELVPALDQIMEIVPMIEETETTSAKSIRSGLFVTEAFCSDAISAVEQIAELAATKKLDPVHARNQLQFLAAFRPLENKLNAVMRRITHAVRAVKSEVGTKSLQIYRIAQSLASDQRSPGVASHVAAMKLALGRRAATKAVREQRRTERFEAAVEAEVTKRLEAAQRLKEGRTAA